MRERKKAAVDVKRVIKLDRNMRYVQREKKGQTHCILSAVGSYWKI